MWCVAVSADETVQQELAQAGTCIANRLIDVNVIEFLNQTHFNYLRLTWLAGVEMAAVEFSFCSLGRLVCCDKQYTVDNVRTRALSGTSSWQSLCRMVVGSEKSSKNAVSEPEKVDAISYINHMCSVHMHMYISRCAFT